MKLWEAIKAMEEGKKITHPTFEYYIFDYLYLNVETEHITNSNGKAFDINGMDAINDKWELYDDRKEVPDRFKWMKEMYKTYKDDCVGHCPCKGCMIERDIKINGRNSDLCCVISAISEQLNKEYKLDI